MSNIKVNYYWCDIDNFGDELNVELMRVLCNWRLKHTPPAMATVLGIGSILDRAVATQNDDVPFFAYAASAPRLHLGYAIGVVGVLSQRRNFRTPQFSPCFEILGSTRGRNTQDRSGCDGKGHVSFDFGRWRIAGASLVGRSLN